MAEQWLSIVEYARTFAVSDMTVRRRIKTGRLQAVLKEGKYYIPIGPGSMQPAAETASLAPELTKPSELAVPGKNIEQFAQPIVTAPFNETDSLRLGASFRTIPSLLSSNLQRYDNTLVDSHALLQFCDQSVTRINSIERHLQEGFQVRLQTLESQLKVKDNQIAKLMQQVEDLQMLIKLMEQG